MRLAQRITCVRTAAAMTMLVMASAAFSPLGAKPLVISAGDRQSIAVVVEEERKLDGKPVVVFTRRQTYETEVVRTSPQGHSLRITLKDFAHTLATDATGRQATALAAQDAVLAALRDRPVEIESDTGGRLLRVLQWEQVRDAISGPVTSRLEAILLQALTASAQNASPETLKARAAERATALAAQTLSNRTGEEAVSALFPEIAAAAMMQVPQPGTASAPGKAGALPLSAGDRDLVAKWTVSADRVDGEQKRASFNWQAEFDAGKLKERALAGVKAQLESALKTVESDTIRDDVRGKFERQFASTRMSRSDRRTAAVSTETGRLSGFEAISTMSSEQDGRPREERTRTVRVTAAPKG